MNSLVNVKVIINSDSPIEMTLDINSTLSKALSLIIETLGPSLIDSRYKFFFTFLGAKLVDIQINIDNCQSRYCDLGSLDDNLLNVRKILQDNPIIPISFKFVRGRCFISEAEEKRYGLRETLDDSDELFIYSENSYKNVIICKYLQSDNNIDRDMKYLPITEKLIQVQTLLKMGPNLVFYDGDIKINRSLETSIDWINIAWIEDEKLKLKQNLKSFTIDITKIKPELEKGLYSGNAIFKCEQKFNRLFNEQLTLNGRIAPSVPLSYLLYLSLLANVSYESSESHN
ncbi:4751_t:CDS:2, partial [Gigaspora margarita]